MRYKQTLRKLGVALSYVLFPALAAHAVVCSSKPAPPAVDINETTVQAIYATITLETAGCSVAGDSQCAKRAADLTSLENDLLQAMALQSACANSGTNAALAPLSQQDKDYYASELQFLRGVYTDMTTHSSSVNDGTYTFPLATQKSFLGIPQTPVPLTPVVTVPLANGAQKILIHGQGKDSHYSSSTVAICISETPTTSDTADCTTSSPSKASPLTKLKDGSSPTSTDLDKGGDATVGLAKLLTTGEYVSVIQTSKPARGGPDQKAISQSYVVSAPTQCNQKPFHGGTPFSDCDLVFSLIGGIEQSALASQPSATDGFVRVFTRAGTTSGFNVWGEIRLLSSPQQSSTSGVISAFTDPSGTIQTTTFSNVGTSIDYMIGMDQTLARSSHGSYTASALAGFGGTTPLSANSVAQAFAAPAFGTVECNTLYSKFASYFSAQNYNIIKGSANQATGTTAGATTSACLLNTNSPSTAISGATTYAPINNIGFSNQDRHNILGKYEFGIRTIDRFLQPGYVACGDLDPANRIAPCQRGIVDFTVGADASITGGVFRKWIFKVEAVHPLPIKGTAFLYLFGSFSMRFQRNETDTPLILQTASTATLSGTGSTAVPNVNTVVLPLIQPNRDFYRFGVGVDVACIFNKIFTSGSTCLAAPSVGAASPPTS